jgi:hypothetical protein
MTNPTPSPRLNHPRLVDLGLTPEALEQWCRDGETSRVVGHAIHAISTSIRSPDEIWSLPTPDEEDRIRDAIANLVEVGLYEREASYWWGGTEIEAS